MGENLSEVGADDEVAHRFDRHAANVVAAADGEGQAVVSKIRRIRIDNDVGRRIIWIGIHRIGSIKALRRGEAEIEDTKVGDAGHGCSSRLYALII